MDREVQERLYRDLTPNQWWLFSWLVYKTSWAESKWFGYPLKKGELGCTQMGLSVDLKLTRDQIRTALEKLQKLDLIVVETPQGFPKASSLISINNYDQFCINQSGFNAEPPNNPQTIPISKEVKAVISKEVRQNTIEQNGVPPNAFETIWKRYPRPLGKKQAEKHFKASVKSIKDWLDIQNALDCYLKVKPDDPQYIKHGSTWFNNWKDYVNYETPESEIRPLKANSDFIPTGIVEGKYAELERKQKELYKKEVSNAGTSERTGNDPGVEAPVGKYAALGERKRTESGGQS